ncbi:hypothetical protein BDZ89DRAFT_1041571 [Hymenopellis radicata]|nr:hypothetical protein BDZ89DRAFT_1041571 [Hymenopellis radicata]
MSSSSNLAQEFGITEEQAIRMIGDYMNDHVLAIFSYGLYSMVFAATLRQIIVRDQWARPRIVLTVLVCVIWALATMYFGMIWNALYSTYVTHGQSQDSILGYLVGAGEGALTPERLALNVVSKTAITVNAMLAELINIWRCWELYGRSWFVVALPLLAVISAFTAYPSSSSPYIARLIQINWTVVYYAITASLNIATTGLIVGRIVRGGGLKRARKFRGIIEILIESAFMYAAVYVVYLAMYVHFADVPANISYAYIEGLLNAVTAAAPTMIIGRVMSGEATPKDSDTRTSLPHLNTGMRSLGESIQFARSPPTNTQTSSTNDFASTPNAVSDNASTHSHTSTNPQWKKNAGFDIEKGVM